MKNRNLFTLILAMLLLASCGSGTTEETNAVQEQDTAAAVQEQDTAATETETQTPLEKLNSLTFEGSTYRIAAMDKMADVYPNYMAASEMTGELLNDTAFQRNTQVEEMFDITLDVQFQATDGTGQGMIAAVTQSVSSGEDTWDLIQFSSAHDNIAPLLEQHMLYNILDVPHLTLDASYFYGENNAQFEINNFLPIGFSSYNNSTNEPLYMVFNKNLMNNLGMEYPYDTILEGDWTFDAFLSCIKGVTTDMDGDGNIQLTDQHGYANSVALTNYLVWGFDVDITERTDTGNYVPSLRNDKLINAFQKIVGFANENEDTWPNDADGSSHIFMSGNVLFSTTGTGRLTLRNIEEFDFGIAPYPKYDENQTEYYSFIGLNQFGVPTTIGNPEMTGAVLEALSYLSEKDMTPAFLETYIENKFLRDEESIEVMKILLANPVTDIVRYYNFAEISPVNLLATIKDAGQVFSTIATVENSAADAAEEFFGIFFEN